MTGKHIVSNTSNSFMLHGDDEAESRSNCSKLPSSSEFETLNDESFSTDFNVKFERSVRINVQDVSVHFIPHLKDLSIKDRRLLWITSEELARFRAGNKQIIQQLDISSDHYGNQYCPEDEDDTLCYRGLEHKTIRGSKMRKLAKKDAATAVFLEQYRQSKQTIRDVERLRDKYRACAAACEKSAYQTGLLDAKAALAANNFSFPMAGTPKSTLETEAVYTMKQRARRTSLAAGKDWTLATTKATGTYSRKTSTLLCRIFKFASGPNDLAR
jgi:hypothetical protein